MILDHCVNLMRFHVQVNSAFSGGKDNSTEQENAGADLEVSNYLLITLYGVNS